MVLSVVVEFLMCIVNLDWGAVEYNISVLVLPATGFVF